MHDIAIESAVEFAVESTMRMTAPPGALRPRRELRLRLALGGLLGRAFHLLGIPFQWTPLFAIPFALLGAWLHFSGLLWAGVLCSVAVWALDIADGVATGLCVNHLPPEARPRRAIVLRRFLDTFIADPIAHLSLYAVFLLLLQRASVVADSLLVLLALVESLNVLLAGLSECASRCDEFFYEFVLNEQGKRNFAPFYYVRVIGGHLSAYYVYSLFPLLGYLTPIAHYGAVYFYALLAVRGLVLTARLVALASRTGLDRRREMGDKVIR